MRTPTLVLLALLAAAAATLRPVHAGAAPKPAPAVTLQRADGTAVQLSDYKGKIVLVDFWASWCPPCKASFPALDVIYKQYRDRGVEVLAVNLDERRKDAEAFLNGRSTAMTVLFDPKGASPVAFGVKGMPSSFLIDRSGNIRYTHMGYTGNVDESYRLELGQLLTER